MSKARDIIVKPIITEKTMALQSVNNWGLIKLKSVEQLKKSSM